MNHIYAEVPKDYSLALGKWIEQTIESQDPNEIEAIRDLWNGQSWNSIVEKFQNGTDYQWWQEGLINYG
jgi:hypothetical protein